MKKILKQLFIPALTSRPVTSIANRLFNCGVPVFMLHRIEEQDESSSGKITAAHLRNCLGYLADHDYSFITLEKLVLALKNNQKLPTNSVVFTMDDGYADQAEIAAPIFLEYNCPVTFFVITGMLDQTIWPWDAKVSWIVESTTKPFIQHSAAVKNLNLNLGYNDDKRTIRRSIQDALKKTDISITQAVLQQLADETGVMLPEIPPPSYKAMTWDLARKLEDQGICFAPHSVNHNILSRLSQKTMEDEIHNSWQSINNELNNPLKVFCYPNGIPVEDYSEREIITVKNSGYMSAVSTTPGFVRSDSSMGENIYSLPRLALPDNMTDFIKYCSWIESARESFFKTGN